MSGKIKTGDTTWSSASDVYVKTTDTSWNRARTAYVKTDASTWSLWFRSSVSDTFGRTTSGSLGAADTGESWLATSGTWYANGSSGQSDTAASSYPIASIDFGTEDVTVSASVSPGTGPAVWVNSSGDWYAAIAYQTQVNGTYPCNCSCNGHSVGYTVYCSSATCPPCTTTYTATTTPCTSTSLTSVSGWSYQGSAAPYRISRCTTSQINDPYNLNCIFQGDCYSGGGGSTCYYNCPGDQQVGHPGCCSCYAPIYTTTYICPAGCTGGGALDNCTSTTAVATCNTCSDPSFGVCGSGSYFVSGGTYPNCDGYGSSCQTCGTLVDAYYMRLIRSVGGTITTVGSDISLSSAAAAIKITTSGDSINYQAYSDTTLATPLGSAGSYTPTSPTKSTKHGIIKAPSAYAQGSTVDNFKVSG